MTNVIDQFSKDLNQFITILKSKNKSLSNILSKNKFINEKKPVKNFILYHESYEEKFSLIMNEIIDNLEKYQESQDIKYLRKVFGRYPNYSHLSASGKLEKLRELFYLFCKQLLMKAREEVKKHHAIIKSFPKVEEIFQSYFEELIINHQDKRYSSGRLFDIINQINGFYGPIYQQKSEAKIEEKGLAKIYSKLKPIEEVYDEVWEPNIILYGLRPRINIHLYYKEIRFTAVKSILKKSSQRYSQSRQTHDITQYGYDLLLSLPEKTLLQMILKTLRNVLKVGLLTYREEVSLAPIYNLCCSIDSENCGYLGVTSPVSTPQESQMGVDPKLIIDDFFKLFLKVIKDTFNMHRVTIYNLHNPIMRQQLNQTIIQQFEILLEITNANQLSNNPYFKYILDIFSNELREVYGTMGVHEHSHHGDMFTTLRPTFEDPNIIEWLEKTRNDVRIFRLFFFLYRAKAEGLTRFRDHHPRVGNQYCEPFPLVEDMKTIRETGEYLLTLSSLNYKKVEKYWRDIDFFSKFYNVGRYMFWIIALRYLLEQNRGNQILMYAIKQSELLEKSLEEFGNFDESIALYENLVELRIKASKLKRSNSVDDLEKLNQEIEETLKELNSKQNLRQANVQLKSALNKLTNFPLEIMDMNSIDHKNEIQNASFMKMVKNMESFHKNLSDKELHRMNFKSWRDFKRRIPSILKDQSKYRRKQVIGTYLEFIRRKFPYIIERDGLLNLQKAMNIGFNIRDLTKIDHIWHLGKHISDDDVIFITKFPVDFAENLAKKLRILKIEEFMQIFEESCTKLNIPKKYQVLSQTLFDKCFNTALATHKKEIKKAGGYIFPQYFPQS